MCVTSGNKQASVRKETVAVSATKPKIVSKKPEHNAATPSEPTLSRGGCVSKKRSIRGKSNHESILRQPCRYYLKGTCTRSPCEYWHPPECQFYKTETGCKAVDKCLVPHLNVDDIQTKIKKGYYSHKRRESDDQNGVAIVNIVLHLGCVSQDSELLDSQRGKQGKPDAKRPGTDSKNTIHSVYATSSEYPGKERTIACKNTSQKLLISEVPTL